MYFLIGVPDELVPCLQKYDFEKFQSFLQGQMDRYVIGALRYGKGAKAEKKYMTRLSAELAVYERTGNKENLYNIAVYSHLESAAPENIKFHFNPAAASATRGKLKRAVERRVERRLHGR